MAERIKIGFFDSGVGGISVMACAKKHLPNADYLYYADTAHVPYGTKNREEIIAYADDAVKFLIGAGADVVVVACNTATSMAIEHLRSKYSVPIVGMEPAVKTAATVHPGENVLVCATAVTIAGEKLHSLITNTFTDGVEPTLVALPGLVNFAEEGEFDFNKISDYLLTEINNTNDYAAIVLGCTHFTYFKDSFRALFKNADIIDGNLGTVRRLESIIRDRYTNAVESSVSPCTVYFMSGVEVRNKETIEFFKNLEKKADCQY